MNFEALKEQHGEDAVKEAFILGVTQGLKQAQEWRPIETAPKDGTDILVYNKDRGEQFVAYWSCGWNFSPNHYLGDDETTHWQPLPPAPKEQQK